MGCTGSSAPTGFLPAGPACASSLCIEPVSSHSSENPFVDQAGRVLGIQGYGREPVTVLQALSVLNSRLPPLIHRNLNDVANGEGASPNIPVTGAVSSALTIGRFGATIAL